MLSSLLILTASIFALWLGSGLAVSSVEKLSKRTQISSFITSFFALGLLTSLGEISVGFFSIINKTPGISVGNLLGASVVLTLLIIPIQVLTSRELTVDNKTGNINLPIAYFVISLPVILMLDKTLNYIDAIIMISAYFYLLFTISGKRSLVEKFTQTIAQPDLNIYNEFLKIACGATIVIVASKLTVDNLVSLSDIISISPFVVGLVALSLGTNIPELTILIRSIASKKRDIALGDYVGSASLNTLLLSLLVLANGVPIKIDSGIKPNLLLLPFGAVLFLLFTKNKKFEKTEATLLIILYVLFILFEFIL